METREIIDTLLDLASHPSDLAAAFETAKRLRSHWPIVDLIEYQDLTADGQLRLPDAREWMLEADTVTKPKHSGAIRSELLPDILTGTLLQLATERILDHNRFFAPNANDPFASLRVLRQNNYQSWTKTINRWTRHHLAAGRCVIFADLNDYFFNIKAEQIHTVLANSGLSERQVSATIALFEMINRGNSRSHFRGLPVVPDEIVWVISDRVLVPVDEILLRDPHILEFARWIDDIFITCDPSDSQLVCEKLNSVSQLFGFSINQSKYRVVKSLEAYDESHFYREHLILDDLFEVASHMSKVDFDLLTFSENALGRKALNQSQASIIAKRVYTLARIANSKQLVDVADTHIREFPSAESQILHYLASIGWEGTSIEVLTRSLQDPPYQSTQLYALWSLLIYGDTSQNEQILDLCQRIANGEGSAHEFSRCLAQVFLTFYAESEYEHEFELSELSSLISRRSSLVTRSLSDCWKPDPESAESVPQSLLEYLSSDQFRDNSNAKDFFRSSGLKVLREMQTEILL